MFVSIPFLCIPTNCLYFLTSSNTNYRTRMLDAWFREVAFYYRDMPATAREAVRTFLNFDMKKPTDVFVHDQLAWGMMETPKADAPLLIVRHSTIIKLHDSVLDESQKHASQSAGTEDSTQTKAIRYNLKDSNKASDKDRHSNKEGKTSKKSPMSNSSRTSSSRPSNKAKSVA